MPFIDAHEKDLDRGLAIDAVIFSLQVVVVPAKLLFEHVTVGGWAKVDVAILLARSVAPSSDDHFAFLARLLVPAALVHADIPVDCAVEEYVEPSAGRMSRDYDLAEQLVVADFLPV